MVTGPASAFPNASLCDSVEFPVAVTVQGFHDADAQQNRWAAALGDQKQRLHRNLPFWRARLSVVS
jgi:hypothetical protein